MPKKDSPKEELKELQTFVFPTIGDGISVQAASLKEANKIVEGIKVSHS